MLAKVTQIHTDGTCDVRLKTTREKLKQLRQDQLCPLTGAFKNDTYIHSKNTLAQIKAINAKSTLRVQFEDNEDMSNVKLSSTQLRLRVNELVIVNEKKTKIVKVLSDGSYETSNKDKKVPIEKITRCSSRLVDDLNKLESMSRSNFLTRLQELELEDVSVSDWKKFAATYATKTKGSGFFSGAKVDLNKFLEELEEASCRDGAALDEPPRENQRSPKKQRRKSKTTTKDYVKVKTELRRVLMRSVRAFEEQSNGDDNDEEQKEEEEEIDVLTFFQDIDKDNSGYIERQEFVKAVKELTEKVDATPSKEDLDQLIRCFDLRRNGKIDYNEFVSFARRGLEDEEIDIIANRLREKILPLKKKKRDDLLHEKFREMDKNGDGTVTLDEFTSALKKYEFFDLNRSDTRKLFDHFDRFNRKRVAYVLHLILCISIPLSFCLSPSHTLLHYSLSLSHTTLYAT